MDSEELQTVHRVGIQAGTLLNRSASATLQGSGVSESDSREDRSIKRGSWFFSRTPDWKAVSPGWAVGLPQDPETCPMSFVFHWALSVCIRTSIVCAASG